MPLVIGDPCTLKDLVIAACEAQGYDGLFNAWSECACAVDDLFPCGEPHEDCTLGVKQEGCTCGNGCDFHIVAKDTTQDDKDNDNDE